MAGKRRSLQDRIRDRQQSDFVGRQQQITQYQDNLKLSLDGEQRYFIFNIHGDAGIGKTYLVKQLQRIADETDCLTAYVDETVDDVAAAMSAIADQLKRSGIRLKEFEKRASAYRKRRHELEADPQAPDGIAAFLTKAAVTISLAALRDVPMAGCLLAAVNPLDAGQQANQARIYLARKINDHEEMRLLLSPMEALTPYFVDELYRVAADRRIALFFDAYERTGILLDQWLRRMYEGTYGLLPETLVTTIAGQSPFNSGLWGNYLPVIADIPLEPFNEIESRQFLTRKGIDEESVIEVILSLSGCLPMWLATLAAVRPGSSSEIGDPAGEAVERILRWENDPEKRSVAQIASLPRSLNRDVLAAAAPDSPPDAMFDWLCGLPFVARKGESWAYHQVVRDAMLRWQRSKAPSNWRTSHSVLACANKRWADEVAGGREEAWENTTWIDRTRERIYHLLCADPVNNLSEALTSAVKAAAHGGVYARQWASLIGDAGRDTGSTLLSEWAKKLNSRILEHDLSSYLAILIDEAGLNVEALIVALRTRAINYLIEGYHEKAVADFTRAIDLDPRQGILFAGRGDSYRRMNQHEKGLADLTRAVELSPKQPWILLSRGMVYQNMGRGEDASTDCAKAVEIDPNLAWILANQSQQRLAKADRPTLPVTIYLSDGGINPIVEEAVTNLLASASLWIADRDEPIIGSWFRQMRANMTHPELKSEAFAGALHATDRIALDQDAAATASLLQNLPPVLTALHPTKDAVLRVGSLLVVKVDWQVTVAQLTEVQQAVLDHQPQLARAPHDIIAALDLIPIKGGTPELRCHLTAVVLPYPGAGAIRPSCICWVFCMDACSASACRASETGHRLAQAAWEDRHGQDGLAGRSTNRAWPGSAACS